MYFRIVLFLLFFFTINSYCAEELSVEDKFSFSPKFLVHIGFGDGLPVDGIMRASSHDPALYFSLNGPFPSTPLMAKLDKAPYILIFPLDELVRARILSFHPTEILLAGDLIIDKTCHIISPIKAKLPKYYKALNVHSYGKGLQERNEKAYEILNDLGAFPAFIELDDKGSWTNTSIVRIKEIANRAHVDGETFLNMNDERLYSNLKLGERIFYSCPASSYIWNNESGQYQPIGIGHLSELKAAIYSKTHHQLRAQRIKQTAQALTGWIEELDHLDDIAKKDFLYKIKQLTLKYTKTGLFSCFF